MKEKRKATASKATRDPIDSPSPNARNAEYPGWMSISERSGKPGHCGPHYMMTAGVDYQARATFALTGLVSLLRLLSDEEQATKAIYRVLDHWELSALFNTLAEAPRPRKSVPVMGQMMGKKK
ncbi:hypothetical protein [Caballeronia sp. GAWG1-1]|uniref:hypothetical protein n=1 Tax=Caballeronia sp. GAWG1-1 TaxID=2921742 RepID=UPI0020294F31|nr:hypothetical protein [Caballeronia sp. GAWG1-1]